MNDIAHLLRIHAHPDRVFAAISTAAEIQQWWTRDAAIEPRRGGCSEFAFNDRRFVAQVAVEDIQPASHMRWRVTNGAWPGSEIEFLLQPDDKGSVLVFGHRGWPRADQAFASATTRWGFYLLSLKQYIQTGTGTPNPDDAQGLS